jgi:hypothetical protein
VVVADLGVVVGVVVVGVEVDEPSVVPAVAVEVVVPVVVAVFVVVPGISSATAVPIPTVPRTAPTATAAVVRRILLATALPPRSRTAPSAPGLVTGVLLSVVCRLPDSAWTGSELVFLSFNDGGLSVRCGGPETLL